MKLRERICEMLSNTRPKGLIRGSHQLNFAPLVPCIDQ
jgi:hypothetical protein